MVGFGFVALPLLIAVVWALFNLDRVAEQSELLVVTGVSAAESNRRLNEQISSLERLARQYQVLKNPESLQLIAQDLDTLESQLSGMRRPARERRCNRTGRINRRWRTRNCRHAVGPRPG